MIKLHSIIFIIIISVNSSAQISDELSIVFSNCNLNVCECKANKNILYKTANLDSLSKIIEEKNSIIINDTAQAACEYHMLAAYFYNNRNYKKAINHNKKAISLRMAFDDGFLWKSYMNIGVALSHNLEYLEAIKYLTLSYYENKPKRIKDSVLIFRYLGTNYSDLGELKKAEEFAEKSISIKNAPTTEIAKAFLDYSTILIETEDVNNIKRALSLVDSSLLYFGGQNDYLKALNNESIVHRRLGNYDKAEKISSKILDYAAENTEIKSGAYNSIGIIKIRQKLYKEAIINLNASVEIFQKHKSKIKYFDYAACYGNLGESYDSLDILDKALTNYQLAIVNSTNNFKSKDVFESPNISDKLYVYDNIDFIHYLDAKGKIAYQLYKKGNQLKYLDLARDTYETAFEFHGRLYNQITTQNSRLLQAKTIMPYIENALKVQYEYKQLDKNYKPNAFKFIELNKVSVLMQEINESQALKKVGIPEDTLLKEKGLRVSIASLKETISQSSGENISKKKELDEELFNLKDQHDHLVLKLESDYPAYKNLKYQPSDLQLSEVQQQLDESSAILEYFVGDSAIYIMTIQKELVDLFQLEKPKDFEFLVNSFRDSIIRESGDFIQNAHRFYKIFVEAPLGYLNDDIIKLTIIPDAELNYIPFEILLTELCDANNVNYKNLPYLVNEKQISYAYSSELLLKSATEKSTITKSNYAIYAGDYSNSNLAEITCDLLTDSIPSLLSGQAYKDDACTIENFKKTANQNKIINFFLHGDTGRVVFTPLEYSADYTLDLSKLYSTDLNNVELAVLTACMTGFGPYQKGEGVMSVSRAFTYSGCSSLVMSLWYVPANSTCKLIDQFLRELYQGKSKDEALRAAKKDYMKDCGTYCHPKYWAGFVSSGNTSPIQFQ